MCQPWPAVSYLFVRDATTGLPTMMRLVLQKCQSPGVAGAEASDGTYVREANPGVKTRKCTDEHNTST
jgi:hypothetical protein